MRLAQDTRRLAAGRPQLGAGGAPASAAGAAATDGTALTAATARRDGASTAASNGDLMGVIGDDGSPLPGTIRYKLEQLDQRLSDIENLEPEP